MIILFFIIAFFASLCAGIINTLAGNGSVLTLSVLMYLFGLPAKEANATIRVGVFAASVGALPAFVKKGLIQPQRDFLVVLCMTLGALIGIFTALWLDNSSLKEIFKYLFILMLIISLIDNKSWLKKTEEQNRLPLIQIIPIYLILGFYGGFVQMGIGVFFLFVTVIFARYHIIDASALRTLCIALYTPVAILIFAIFGLIHWEYALLMALGEWLGGKIGSRFATGHPDAGVWARKLLIGILVIAILMSFWPEK
jgi:uncharacterized membrane protein YfcA